MKKYYKITITELLLFLGIEFILGFIIGVEAKQIEVNKIKKHNKICCLDGGWNCE